MGAFMLRIACCLAAPGTNGGALGQSFRMILSASFCCNSSLWRTTRPFLQGMSSAPMPRHQIASHARCQRPTLGNLDFGLKLTLGTATLLCLSRLAA